MVPYRCVDHLEIVPVCTRQVDEDLRVVTAVDRAHVREDDPQAAEEEQREAEERKRTDAAVRAGDRD